MFEIIEDYKTRLESIGYREFQRAKIAQIRMWIETMSTVENFETMMFHSRKKFKTITMTNNRSLTNQTLIEKNFLNS